MIGEDGSLSVRVRGRDVTWFQFLQATRLANSKAGCWNSKSYWLPWGLDRLNASIVKQWTKTSLHKSAPPEPRTKQFKLGREDSKYRTAATKRGEEALKSGVNELMEADLNAVLHTKSWPADSWGRFLGYEVPLAQESDGQLKIDLLGIGDGFLSLVELKQAHSPSNSPLMALTEAICYSIQIGRCKKYLCKENSDVDFKAIRLILAAPGDYWDYWNFEKHEDWSTKMNQIVKSVSEILSDSLSLNLKLEIFSLVCENDKLQAKQICCE